MERLKKSHYYLQYIAIALILVTCTSPMPQPATLPFTGASQTSIPITETTHTSPIITPSDKRISTSPLPLPTETVPTPFPDLATILGTLLVMDPRYGAPKKGDSIYLVPIEEQTQNGLYIIPEVDLKHSHKAIVNKATGEFTFINVPPGRYQILVITPVGTLPVRNMETGKIEILDIKANQALDLGRVQIP